MNLSIGMCLGQMPLHLKMLVLISKTILFECLTLLCWSITSPLKGNNVSSTCT